MKNFSIRDCFFVALLVLLIAFLSFGTGKGKGKSIPRDERHNPIYDSLKSGRTMAETELVCSTCHGKNFIPLPANHPPKEQCLICHLLA